MTSICQRGLVPLVALLVMGACGGREQDHARADVGGGGDAGGQSQPPGALIVITPASARLMAGGAPLELTAALGGDPVAIVWSLDGPGALSSTRGTAVTYTPPARLPADAGATITAAGGGASATATISLGRTPALLVAGQVVDGSRAPVPGITVSIGDRSVVTDGAGRFSLDEVTTPYALTALSREQNEAVVYQGLTRTDPTIVWRRRGSVLDRSGQVAGTIDGGMEPSSGGTQTVLAFFSPEAQTRGQTSTPGYVLPLTWSGIEATTGSVRVLQVTSPVPGGLPTSFPGYGVRGEVTVVDGVTTPEIDVLLAPPAVSSVRGSYRVPDGYSLFARFFALVFDDGAFMSLGFDDGAGLDFTYLAPSDVGAKVQIVAEADGEGTTVLRRESGIAPGATGLALALPRGAPSIAPADGAEQVDAQTEFAWGGFDGGVFIVDFTASGRGPTFHVVTGETRTTLPEVPGLPVPSEAGYGWTVTALAPFGSMDDAAGPRALSPEGNTLLQSFSDPRSFTTR